MYFFKGNLIIGINKRVYCIFVGVYKFLLYVYVVNWDNIDSC